MSKRKMSLQDACDIVPDDLPDGAYWAMAHEIAGAEIGEAWEELNGYPTIPSRHVFSPKIQCRICKKIVRGEQGLAAHHRDKHKRH